MSGGSISQSVTKLDAVQIQSSSLGVTIPLVYGVTRVAVNLVWYGGFKATSHSNSQGGKGGTKSQNTSYTYSASVAMGVCHGPISGIPTIWVTNSKYAGGLTPTQLSTSSESYTPPATGAMTYSLTHGATYAAMVNITNNTAPEYTVPLAQGTDYTVSGGVLTILLDKWRSVPLVFSYQYTTGAIDHTALQQLGMSFKPGPVAQTAWSALASYGSANLGYSGLALLCAQDYDLGTSATVGNHKVEVIAPLAYHLGSSQPDVDPSLAMADVLINGRYGAGFNPAKMDGWSDWSDWCVASGLLVSPAMTTQQKAADVLALAAQLTNTAAVWTGGVLRMVPYGDTAVTANGRTFTPNTTPVYSLDDDSWVAPLQVNIKTGADRKNHIRVEYWDRSNEYNVAIAEAKDEADIDANGLRSANILQAHWITTAAVARQVAQMLLQRSLYVVNEYTGTLPWHYALLDPADLVTVTDAGIGMAATPLRVKAIEENDAGDLQITLEDYPAGTVGAPQYPAMEPAGYQADYNAAPGSVSAPLILEAPGALTVNGLELYVAATGTGAHWGGCKVWVSLDGTNYKWVGTLYGGSRYGTLTNAPTSSGTVSVALLTGQLVSGSAADAAALNTLAYIGGAAPEFFAFQTATLTSALHYDLGGNTRGAYGTAAAAHSIGDPFARLDSAIAKSGPIDLGYVGKAVHVKCTSFNIYGGAEESLASVTDYTYTITGSQVLGNAGAAAYAGVVAASSDNILSAGEKPQVITDYAVITSEQSGIDAQATAYGITTEKTAYDSAISALTSYLGTLTSPTAWNSTTGDTTIVGSTFRSNFEAVYSARQTLLNKIASVAGTLAAWSGVSGQPSAVQSSLMTVYSKDRYLAAGPSNDYPADSSATGGYAARFWTGWVGYTAYDPAGDNLSHGWVLGKTYRVLARVKKVGAPTTAIIGLYNQTTTVYSMSVDPIASLTTAWQTIDLGTMTANWAAGDSVYLFHGASGMSPSNSAADSVMIDWLYFQPVNAAEGATVNIVTYSSTTPASPQNGDVWVNTSTTPPQTEVYVSGAWQVGANLSTNTNQLTDGANLGGTAVWTGVSGAGKPADNATVGAPSGTPVAGTFPGNTPAGTVENNANDAYNGLTAAITATLGGTFTKTVSGATSGTQIIGTLSVSASGGTAPLSYLWWIGTQYSDLDNGDSIYLTGTLTGTGPGLSGYLSGTTAQAIHAQVNCVVTDANGRTVHLTHIASLTHT
jgi:hypothetical protein